MSTTVDCLNRLLHAEHASLITALREAYPFVSWRSADDRLVMDQMLADATRHEHELVQLILELRGSPAPGTVPTEMGSVNYLGLTYLIPAILADKRRLVTLYESTPATGDPSVNALKNHFLDDHRRHLASLEKLHGNLIAQAHVLTPAER